MLVITAAEIIQIIKSTLYLTYIRIDFSQLNDVITKNENHTPYTLRYSYYI
jgi:hypothetical protein